MKAALATKQQIKVGGRRQNYYNTVMQALYLKERETANYPEVKIEMSQTLISNDREDRSAVVTDAKTVLEIAKVFDELSPQQDSLVSPEEIDIYRDESIPPLESKRTVSSSKRTTLVL